MAPAHVRHFFYNREVPEGPSNIYSPQEFMLLSLQPLCSVIYLFRKLLLQFTAGSQAITPCTAFIKFSVGTPYSLPPTNVCSHVPKCWKSTAASSSLGTSTSVNSSCSETSYRKDTNRWVDDLCPFPLYLPHFSHSFCLTCPSPPLSKALLLSSATLSPSQKHSAHLYSPTILNTFYSLSLWSVIFTDTSV